MTEYSMEPKPLYGQYRGKARYDLLSVIMVCIGKAGAASEGNKLHRLLETVLPEKLAVGEKKDILEQEYGFEMDREVDGRMTDMCNLSQGIEERGREKGRAEGRIEGRAEEIVESSLEFGLPESKVLERLQTKLDITIDTAREYFEMYGNA